MQIEPHFVNRSQ